jgi:hypothetical protein
LSSPRDKLLKSLTTAQNVLFLQTGQFGTVWHTEYEDGASNCIVWHTEYEDGASNCIVWHTVYEDGASNCIVWHTVYEDGASNCIIWHTVYEDGASNCINIVYRLTGLKICLSTDIEPVPVASRSK